MFSAKDVKLYNNTNLDTDLNKWLIITKHQTHVAVSSLCVRCNVLFVTCYLAIANLSFTVFFFIVPEWLLFFVLVSFNLCFI